MRIFAYIILIFVTIAMAGRGEGARQVDPPEEVPVVQFGETVDTEIGSFALTGLAWRMRHVPSGCVDSGPIEVPEMTFTFTNTTGEATDVLKKGSRVLFSKSDWDGKASDDDLANDFGLGRESIDPGEAVVINYFRRFSAERTVYLMYQNKDVMRTLAAFTYTDDDFEKGHLSTGEIETKFGEVSGEGIRSYDGVPTFYYSDSRDDYLTGCDNCGEQYIIVSTKNADEVRSGIDTEIKRSCAGGPLESRNPGEIPLPGLKEHTQINVYMYTVETDALEYLDKFEVGPQDVE